MTDPESVQFVISNAKVIRGTIVSTPDEWPFGPGRRVQRIAFDPPVQFGPGEDLKVTFTIRAKDEE